MSNKKRRKSDNVQKVKSITAKTENQKDYIRAICDNDVVFCTGPSGSGKSFIAAGIAAEHLHRDNINRIIVTRPLVCTGKSIGHLPGDLMDKINPYVMPMQENFLHFLGRQYYGLYCNDQRIVYYPLEVMRGSTFHNAYMILDEAQNCDVEQIKMFITRMGEGSKVLINGDVKQTDLHEKSGLAYCIAKLQDVDGVGVCNMTYSDIQRNGIIGDILAALEE